MLKRGTGTRRVRVVLGAAGVVLLGGCASPAAGADTSAPQTASPALEPARQAPPVPELSAERAALALETADAVMTRFVRGELPAAEWAAGLYPLLTEAAGALIARTDPALVLATAVTGVPLLRVDSTGAGAVLQVPTDAGLYTLLLLWDERGGGWRCDRIAPAEGAR